MIRLITLLGYGLLLATAVLLEIDARRRGAGTFGDAVALLLRSRLTRVLLVTAWLWLGWHLFARVDWR